MKIHCRYIFFILTGLLLCINTEAQRRVYDEIKKYYHNIEKSGYGYSPSVKFIKINDVSFDENLSIIQIILIRHGVPKIRRDGWVSFYEARKFVQAYDTVIVYEIEKSPVEIQPGEIHFVYSSPLMRAKSTAKQLFSKDFNIIYDSSFVEFKNEIIPIPWIRLPLRCWRISSRLFWMAGLHSSQVPSLSMEKLRSRMAAAKLASLAKQNERVVLVAHGFLNRYIIRYLKKDGWQHSFDGGYGYNNVQVLTKIVKR